MKASDWLDKSLLRPEGALTGVERVDGFALTKADDGVWASRAGVELDQGKAETFAGRFSGLSVIGVSDLELPETPRMTFALTDESGIQTLRIFHLEADDDYVAVSDRVPGAFEMSSYIAEQMDKTVADFAPDPPEDEEAALEDDLELVDTDQPEAEPDSASP